MADDLEGGRECCRQRRWGEAYQRLSQADGAAPLAVEDLELLADAAYLTGRDEEFIQALDRAHRAHLEANRQALAARCAFWIGLQLLFRGESGAATGWLARARRLLEGRAECAEHGYLLLPEAERQIGSGDYRAARATAAEATRIGERFDDPDLIACGRHLEGRSLIRLRRLEQGLAILDETMVAVTSSELSPVVTGLIYCSVIEACQEVFAVARAREWTSALNRWCEQQDEMVAFTGTCLMRRAEVLSFHGAWTEALDEARRACERHARGLGPQRPGAAYYQQAEVFRLRGEFAAAEEAYRSASRWGREPQPGLALLRLAQGQVEAATAALDRAVSETTDPLRRARLLPAQVEVLLAADECDRARQAAQELEAIAADFRSGLLEAMAAQARGALELSEGDAPSALVSLRRARESWLRLEAPYLDAQARVLIARACGVLGDLDGARMELGAARIAFEKLGANPDVRQLEELSAATATRARRRHGLSPRELEVLRWIAAGKTNREIAGELCISERTVARHVSNIFDKLGLSNRAAAAAYALRHGLV